MTQMYLDLAGVEFAEEGQRAAARAFALCLGQSSGNAGGPDRPQSQQRRQDSNLQHPVLETSGFPLNHAAQRASAIVSTEDGLRVRSRRGWEFP